MNSPLPLPKNQTVLVAEDEPEVRSYLEMALRGQGYTIETADDGDEALEILELNPNISAVLLDIVMPRRDGLETLREIRKINRTVPIIMVSGASSPLNVVDAMKNGANDFLGKPVNHSDLRRVLRSMLEPKTPVLASPSSSPAAPIGKNIFLARTSRCKRFRPYCPRSAGRMLLP